MLEDEMMFQLKNEGYKSKRKISPICRDLISGNLLYSREKMIERALGGYERAEGYSKYSKEAIENRIGAKFDKLIADYIKWFEQFSEVEGIRIIKRHGLMQGVSFTPECKCGEKLMKIDAELTIKEAKKKREKNDINLFYFCYNCGFAGEVKKGFTTRSFR